VPLVHHHVLEVAEQAGKGAVQGQHALVQHVRVCDQQLRPLPAGQAGCAKLLTPGAGCRALQWVDTPRDAADGFVPHAAPAAELQSRWRRVAGARWGRVQAMHALVPALCTRAAHRMPALSSLSVSPSYTSTAGAPGPKAAAHSALRPPSWS
jgi:hypothetical protein